jgi:hypothetical protein
MFKGQKKRHIDWPALKAEWLSGNDSLNHFREKHKIHLNVFYPNIEKGKWREAKDEIMKRAEARAATIAVNTRVEEWKRQMNLWQAVEGIAAQIMTRRRENMNAGELAALTSAIERALKSQKLILGESTENVESRSLSMTILKLIEKVENDGRPPGEG